MDALNGAHKADEGDGGKCQKITNPECQPPSPAAKKHQEVAAVAAAAPVTKHARLEREKSDFISRQRSKLLRSATETDETATKENKGILKTESGVKAKQNGGGDTPGRAATEVRFKGCTPTTRRSRSEGGRGKSEVSPRFRMKHHSSPKGCKHKIPI